MEAKRYIASEPVVRHCRCRASRRYWTREAVRNPSVNFIQLGGIVPEAVGVCPLIRGKMQRRRPERNDLSWCRVLVLLVALAAGQRLWEAVQTCSSQDASEERGAYKSQMGFGF